jgi:hypothetical protein
MQSEAGVRNLEQGIRSPSWETVLRLASALGVSSEAFNQPPAPREAAGPGRPPKAGAKPATVTDKKPRGRQRKTPAVAEKKPRRKKVEG